MPPIAESNTTDTPPLWRTLRRFLPYLWPAGQPGLRARVVAAFGLVLLSKGVLLIMPFAYKAAIDRMVPGGQGLVGLIMALLAAYAAARFGAVLFDNIRNAIFEPVGQDATRALAETTFRHLHALSLRFHLNRRTGAVAKVIERGARSIDTMLYFLLFNLAPTAIELLAVTVIFWWHFGAGLALATLAMVVFYIVYTQRITDWRARLRVELNSLDNDSVAGAVDSLLNYETVKYFNAEAREADRYGRITHAYARAAARNESSLAWLNTGQSFITNVMLGAAMAFTAWGWAQGRFTAGDVVMVHTLLVQLFRPLDMLGMVYRTLRQGVIDMKAMFDLIDQPPEITDQAGAPDLVITGPEIRFDGVNFAYEADRPILKGVSFTIAPGHTLAVVGPSGAGKSTLARLLFRFYDVTGGRILIDGQDIATVTQNSLRTAIGIVPQDAVLFNDTLGYNVAYGRTDADADRVARAVQGAALDRFIATLPEGLDTRVGERGLKLSGGEKQRVAIARALVKDPPILILDEATSALDSRTEAEIQDTLTALARRRTTLVIAHRLSTVVDAEAIAVLDHGRIVEMGTHAELLAHNGLYAEMWVRQSAEMAGDGQGAVAEILPTF